MTRQTSKNSESQILHKQWDHIDMQGFFRGEVKGGIHSTAMCKAVCDIVKVMNVLYVRIYSTY